MILLALDGLFLYATLEELKDSILNSKIYKINQPEKDEIVFALKKDKNSYKLLISASTVYPRIHFTDINKKNPMTPPMFCMILRKYLSNSKITSIYQLQLDRVVFIDFQGKDELGFEKTYTLIIEIMGRHSNISLVEKSNSIILDSIKHITPEINSVRTLLPGLKFVLPPKSNKLNPLDYTYDDLEKFILENNIKLNNTFISKAFMGVSNQLSKEIINSLNSELSLENLKDIHKGIKLFFNKVTQNNFSFFITLENDIFQDFFPIDLSSLEGKDKLHFSSPSKTLEYYYSEKDKRDRLNNKSYSLLKLVNNNLDRCHKKMEILNDNLKKCEKADKYRIYGELLTANIYNIKQGDESIDVVNYYSEDSQIINIKLDPTKTPSNNIQNYFKRYSKLKKSKEYSLEQIKITKDEIIYLNSVLINIKNTEDYAGFEEIKKELMDARYLKFKKNIRKKEIKSKPMHFISSEGIHIYVGKNNIENDYLTLKFADKRDLWFHTKNIPGSHVILKTLGEFTEKSIEEAANLAAFYSKGRDSSKVPVDYTEVRNVHKPNGAKPGMVIYETNKTVFIDPEKPSLEKLS
ncbi:fibronectin/fibrinogen-binding protein [Clostridium tetani]|uniref:Rqc2 homolog RqcH n=1 Tax=Clostridium tetani TaxID=1513 RepID=A0ABY0EPQ4_CLOTA|nr:fibronectin/fibrinogen-binding protein [Clostridium tetani]RXI52445.1 fibronectin/fibrinogen-binding protein [Clostridium tetani]RXI70084.1 fibronectin/fibrinogen-binding protein [Clostridium tetani]